MLYCNHICLNLHDEQCPKTALSFQAVMNIVLSLLCQYITSLAIHLLNFLSTLAVTVIIGFMHPKVTVVIMKLQQQPVKSSFCYPPWMAEGMVRCTFFLIFIFLRLSSGTDDF